MRGERAKSKKKREIVNASVEGKQISIDTKLIKLLDWSVDSLYISAFIYRPINLAKGGFS